MRSTNVRRAPAEWQQRLHHLGESIGVKRPVKLLVSALAQAPMVVGWLRPVVLVPVGALAGLPATQLEALLLHELAHVRRHDFLVNVIQSVVRSAALLPSCGLVGFRAHSRRAGVVLLTWGVGLRRGGGWHIGNQLRVVKTACAIRLCQSRCPSLVATPGVAGGRRSGVVRCPWFTISRPNRRATRIPGGRGECCQTLLADRFQLALHRETRELNVYELKLAKERPQAGTAARRRAAFLSHAGDAAAACTEEGRLRLPRLWTVLAGNAGSLLHIQGRKGAGDGSNPRTGVRDGPGQCWIRPDSRTSSI